ncbi:DUF4153 domain-containing protein [Massilia sp. BSC265]|uniref:DUF4153 domain-containing protein n=1 Tax=Massilia sp. BSC265 TaxID=1549812 RepID=UPI0004E8FC2E|nr:DUF4153 domain-containing protein [Massilia sp. BSC265]KFI07187.1 hypothetical protein JN27_11615 [Massilia sp. BSC265]
MHAAVHDTPDLQARPGIAAARIGIGLLQGLVLYLLYRAGTELHWPATAPRLFVPLLTVSLLAPVIAINALGHMAGCRLLLWTATAAVFIAALAWYDVWRMEGAYRPPQGPEPRGPAPSPQLCLALVAGLFIAHALILAGTHERRRIASYTSYFEIAWKLGVQLAFSVLFVGVTWLVLHLGANLFLLIKLDFLRQAIRASWFAIPVTTFAFATAMHLTDVRPSIVRGIRNLLLVLLSWVLPVLALLVGGFLASLPFTGLAPLWATRSAAAMLLGAAAAFVVLINAAWQNGAAQVVRPVALAARIAALLLVPVTALASHALALRVGDHGWTDDRVIAAACMLVAACYAGGYAAAALRKGWLPTLAGVNIAVAFVVPGVLLALFTPLADPARLATNDQVARLDAGRISAEQFDVGYLHFEGARYGRAALARIEVETARKEADLLRSRIAAVRQLRFPHERLHVNERPRLAENLRVWPAGARLPDSFMRMEWPGQAGTASVPACLLRRTEACDALLLDLGGDARPEVLLISDRPWESVLITEVAGGQWRIAGSLSISPCPAWKQALREGQVRIVAPAWNDLELAGQRIPVTPRPMQDGGCPPANSGQADAPQK